MVSYSPGEPHTCSIAETGLEFLIRLPPPQFWDYRPILLPYPAKLAF